MTKVVFLDRDGVINKYPGHKKYVTTLKSFRFLKGALEAIRLLTRAGYAIFVISNQAGVTKGLYSQATLDKITRRMGARVKKTGGRIRRVLYCLHTKEMNCPCRKPKDGLLRKATKGMRVDKKNSYFIGDSMMDVQAGRAFGCRSVLVFSGREKLRNAPFWDAQPDFVARDLLGAAKNILAGKYERA